MPDLTDVPRRWEVRPTLRLPDIPISNPPDQATLERVADTLRQQPNVVAAHVWTVAGERHLAITASIVLAQPSTPGAAVDEATTLLAQASVVAGLTADMMTEVVAEPGGVEPRTLL